MIVNLKTNYEHNGKLGELVKLCCNTLYCIRLDMSGTVLKIKPENIMSLQPAPYISEHSIFLHMNEMSGSVCNYVRIHEEPGKGQGMQATVDIAKGTRLVNCPEEKQIYFFMPAHGGFQYEPDCYALEMTEMNTPKLIPRTQYFVDALYDIFLGKGNNVCVQAERYFGNVCPDKLSHTTTVGPLSSPQNFRSPRQESRRFERREGLTLQPRLEVSWL